MGTPVTMADYRADEVMRRLTILEQKIDALEHRDERLAKLDAEDNEYSELAQAVPSADYGKWADIRYKYLCANFPEDVRNLIKSQEIYEMLEYVEDTYRAKNIWIW